MKKIKVDLYHKPYDILIGRGLIRFAGRFMQPLRLGPKIFIVSNQKVARYFLMDLRQSLKKSGFQVSVHLLPFGNERDKSAEVLFKLWQAMAESGLDRSSTVVALGGGVVGDLSGFAAAGYMRGIPVIQIPTTLLAQVDSAIGGKTGIDLPAGKNLVGAFHQPKRVIIDTDVLDKFAVDPKTGHRILRSSMAEVIKYGVIEDPILFGLLENQVAAFNQALAKKRFDSGLKKWFIQIIMRSAAVKARVVAADEKETKGLRMILNFGHTFAHGFEAASDYRLPHGEAVAVGMICAARLSVKLGLFPQASETRLFRLIEGYGLPTDFRRYRLPVSKIISAMQKDKKKKSGQMRFVLPVRIGKVIVKESLAQSAILAMIRRVV